VTTPTPTRSSAPPGAASGRSRRGEDLFGDDRPVTTGRSEGLDRPSGDTRASDGTSARAAPGREGAPGRSVRATTREGRTRETVRRVSIDRVDRSRRSSSRVVRRRDRRRGIDRRAFHAERGLFRENPEAGASRGSHPRTRARRASSVDAREKRAREYTRHRFACRARRARRRGRRRAARREGTRRRHGTVTRRRARSRRSRQKVHF